jgi:hypothetical protein
MGAGQMGAWNNPGEQLGWISLDDPDTGETRIRYVKKADVKVEPDQEVHYLDMDDLVSFGGESEEDESEEEK